MTTTTDDAKARARTRLLAARARAKARALVPVNATLVEQFTCCRKATCGTCGGQRRAHGPYWYARWRVDGRTRSAYVGKTLSPAQERQRERQATRARLLAARYDDA